MEACAVLALEAQENREEMRYLILEVIVAIRNDRLN